jgi:hypothetical protein
MIKPSLHSIYKGFFIALGSRSTLAITSQRHDCIPEHRSPSPSLLALAGQDLVVRVEVDIDDGTNDGLDGTGLNGSGGSVGSGRD